MSAAYVERNMESVTYTEITYRNYREPMMPDRFSEPERLVACLAPGMRSDLRHLFFEVRRPLEAHELENPINYKIVYPIFPSAGMSHLSVGTRNDSPDGGCHAAQNQPG
jgi:hypothetical protein